MGSGIVDLLVVGGGPAGTAAAFRARELGLSAIVIDYDDLMKRIRDYSKDKLILPSFGGGDKMCFPKGGELVECLQFQPVDKDQMCADWKELYKEHEIDSRVGLELTGLERQEQGHYRAATWDHNGRTEQCFEARHVVLAIGRGVPRRFDIPGNTDGIAYRLADPKAYLGEVACVLGGGTSAAEAVIAISNAKAQASDPSSVYWSYRGDKMPRVSKALAGEFFAAYVGNGNIRYFRKSDPAAIFVGNDRREYLAVRVDRRMMEGRPNELTLLEFPKEKCIACIGEDIPEALLNSVGIHLVTGGPKARKRMVVNRFLETCQENVYLIGDLLSQAYFETDDFDDDPAGFREIKHRGNVKSALRDGVRVAQVIEQRLAGKKDSEIDIEVGDAAADALSGTAIAEVSRPVDPGGPPRESLAEGRAEADTDALLIRVLPTGIEEEEYAVRADGVTTIGRGDCDISFPSDSMLAPHHGSVSHGEEGYVIRDDGGSTGVFLRVAPARKVELANGDLLRAGRQFLVITAEGGASALVHYGVDGKEIGRYPLEAGKTTVLGRENPDVVLDAEDKTLSRRHLAVAVEDGVVRVKDLKSVNGTFLRVRPARQLEHGDQIRLGQQLFTFSLRGETPLDEGVAAVVPTVTPATPASPTTTGTGEARVVFLGSGSDTPIAVAWRQTLGEAAEAAGVEITSECHSGICGSDPLRIVSGAEHLEAAVGDQERETLEELCELEPGPCRLACMTRVKGPVVVEILRQE